MEWSKRDELCGYEHWESDSGWSVIEVEHPRKFCAMDPDSNVVGYEHTVEKAQECCEKAIRGGWSRAEKQAAGLGDSMTLHEIIFEWLQENTDPTDYTQDQLHSIADLMIRFSSEAVIGESILEKRDS